MPKENPDQTSEVQPGKLPIDYEGDADGIVRITRPAKSEVAEHDEIIKAIKPAEKSVKEAPKVEPEAQEETPKVEPTKEGEEEVPPPKTITEDEHQKIVESLRGGHKGTVDKMRGELAKANQALADAVAQAEEAETVRWFQGIEEQGGDVDVAKKIVERDKALRQAAAELAKREAVVNELAEKLNIAGKGKAAQDLIKTYELGEDALEELLKAEDDKEMEIAALKLVREQDKVKARLAEKPSKSVPSTRGLDLSGKSIEERLGMAAEGDI